MQNAENRLLGRSPSWRGCWGPQAPRFRPPTTLGPLLSVVPAHEHRNSRFHHRYVLACQRRSKSASLLMAARRPPQGVLLRERLLPGLAVGKVRCPGSARASFALLEPVTVPAHLEDVDVVGELGAAPAVKLRTPSSLPLGARWSVPSAASTPAAGIDAVGGRPADMPLRAPTRVTGGRCGFRVPG